MGFRFRRSIRILPGIRLNVSKSGVSTSVGVRGAHVTLGHGKVRETVGLPGTGLSYTHVNDAHHEHHAEPNEVPSEAQAADVPRNKRHRVLVLLLAIAIAAAIIFAHRP